MTLQKWDDLQLKFTLPGLDEVGEDAQERMITPEEARKISEAARKALEVRASIGPLQADGSHLNTPAWFKDYQRLLAEGWPWRVACYLGWASSPKIGRWPGTLNDLATEVLGLKSARVIYTWRNKHPELDTMAGMMQGAEFWQHRRDVLDTLARMAAKDDYKSAADRKLYLEMTGDYIPRSIQAQGKAAKDGTLQAMNDADLRRWAGDDPEESGDVE